MMDGKSTVTVGTAASTAAGGGWLTLSNIESVLGIVGISIGIVATLITLYMQVRWHRKRMRDLERR
jgi:hypothetical protein